MRLVRISTLLNLAVVLSDDQDRTMVIHQFTGRGDGLNPASWEKV